MDSNVPFLLPEPTLSSELGLDAAEDVACEDRDAFFAARLLGLDAFAAAELLLREGTLFDGVHDDMYEGASFAEAEPTITPVAVAGSSSFASAVRVRLVDNAPNEWRRTARGRPLSTSSEVVKFVLHPVKAAELNAQLRRDAVEQSEAGCGEHVSNAGGFHGIPAKMDPDDAGVWHGPLAALLIEALHTMNADGKVGACDIEALEVMGWLNVSSPTAFNRPHDHGGVPYSAVYFVADGGLPARALPAGWAGGVDEQSGKAFYYHSSEQRSQWEAPAHPHPLLARCAGQLIFQTQLAAWADDYAIMSVPPAPGTLLLFPGYMCHAVLPRTLRSTELRNMGAGAEAAAGGDGAEAEPRGTGAVGDAASLRISVACNIRSAADRGVSAQLPLVWQNSRLPNGVTAVSVSTRPSRVTAGQA